MSSSTVLITGANRGIGQGFTKTFLAKPSTTVVVAVRNPEHPTSKALQDLPKADGSKLVTIQLDSTKPEDAATAVAKLKSEHGISSLDIVIANAGIAQDGGRATADLLQASKTGNPIFVAISTLIGSIGSMEALAAFPSTHSPYGGSKAELNWFIRRLHFEEPWLTSFVFHPGLVETDLAAGAVAKAGVKLADIGAISVETSVTAMVSTIDKATRDISGTFQNYDGTKLPW
ncbi:hypothetical protein NW754_011066 [Fusarium falciforme]|nr:hypothetical protein NW754_011066 [Fusarium falciforme]